MELMLEVFLRAVSPLVRKLGIDKVKYFSLGCIENRPGYDVQLCQQTYYREVVERIRRHVTGYLPAMHEQVFTEMRKVGSGDVRFHHSLPDLLGFFWDSSKHYPLLGCRLVVPSGGGARCPGRAASEAANIR